MEAARIAAQRGHTVKLYEKADALGGRLDTLQKLKGTHERILDHKNYLIHQLEVSGVEVVTGQEVTADFVQKEAPDTVIVAVGSQPSAWDSQITVTGEILNMTDMLTALEKDDVLPVGDKVILVGAQFQACEIAVNLMKLGKTVTMLNPGPENEFYMNGAAWPRGMTKVWLRTKGLKLYHNVQLKEITSTQVTFQTEYGLTMTVSGDDVVNVWSMFQKPHYKPQQNQCIGCGCCTSDSKNAPNSSAKSCAMVYRPSPNIAMFSEGIT